MQALSGTDWRIVLMRFYEGHALAGIATALGRSEAAVRKQCQRALEKLGRRLKRRGMPVSASMLAAGLGGALQPSSSAATTTTALLTAACMSVPVAWQWQRLSFREKRLALMEAEAEVRRGAASRSPTGAGRLPGGQAAFGKQTGNATGSHAGPDGTTPPLSGEEAEWRQRLNGPERAAALTDRAQAPLIPGWRIPIIPLKWPANGRPKMGARPSTGPPACRRPSVREPSSRRFTIGARPIRYHPAAPYCN